MTHGWRAGLTATAVSLFSLLSLSAAQPGITLIGTGLVQGDALDRSGLDGRSICRIEDATDCIDQATFGGFGSGLAYTGHRKLFLAVSDRGPFDGRTDVPYKDRVHYLRIDLDTSAAFPNITTTLLDTDILRDRRGALVGDASASDALRQDRSRRFDPEAIVPDGTGGFFISDEYGPSIRQFNEQGDQIRRVEVPDAFRLLDPPSLHATSEVDASGTSFELYPTFNVTGRQANRGMEGLAITPDGRWLVGIMQNALIQDNGLTATTPPGRLSINNRIVKINLRTGRTAQYVYQIDGISQGRGVNEILAINDHEFLVVERDNRSLVPTPPNDPQTPNNKKIYKIDLNTPHLTDVSDIASLPAGALGDIVPVSKSLFIDLLDPSYKVNATQTIKDVIAEKVEGLAWGPDLKDGRHVLYVITDNDLYPGLPTQIYAFAVDGVAAGIDYEPQRIREMHRVFDRHEPRHRWR